jgi:Lrp/AsnC family transcriptional regulator for asnA, asnC and gidA
MDINKLDAFDGRIINELTSDARIPLTAIAKKLKVSNTFIHQRFKKLKDQGILKNATYRLDPYALGYHTSAYTQIMLTNAKQHRKVEKQLSEIPEIVECVNISGRYAILTRIYARNNRHLREIIYEKILPIPGVDGTNTTFSFETAFSRNLSVPDLSDHTD